VNNNRRFLNDKAKTPLFAAKTFEKSLGKRFRFIKMMYCIKMIIY